MEQEITGTVSSIIYQSADGYTVAEIMAGDEPTVVVGQMPGIRTGEVTRFFGEFKIHPRFGRQFCATSCHSTLPVDVNDMVLFLSGGFIKGLGEVLAARIVEEFGEDTFEVMENEPELLGRVKGVSKKLAKSVGSAFRDYADKKYSYAELMGLGLTAHQASVVVAELGGGAAAMVRQNPYLLIDHVKGVDFGIADRIALAQGLERGAPMRLEHGILNVLGKVLAGGNMYVMRVRLEPHVAEKLGVERGAVTKALLNLCLKKRVVLKRYAEGFTVVFPANAYTAEYACAAKLARLAGGYGGGPPAGLDAQIGKQCRKFGLTDEQAAAVRMVSGEKVSVLTGGPGTGKTTILKAVLNILGWEGKSCALAAPTGRAAKRMTEATGAEARTLHRLLEYSYDEDAYRCYFNRNEENPLEYDVVIVDEVSMLDVFLFHSLLRAVPRGAQLVLVGDADQLPPVGPGNVMRDLISSGAVSKMKLTYRFRNEGKIADAAHCILKGKMPEADGREVVFVECATERQAIDAVVAQYRERYRKGEDVQVIAPIKRGEAGTVNLNAIIRDEVNPKRDGKAELAFGERVFRTGDRVMQIRNNYAKEWTNYEQLSSGEGVFNGDIGVIRDIRSGSVYVRFEDGKECSYQAMELAELDGAFAYTIHKSQGSEFDTVIIPVMYDPNPFFTKNLLYTGVTRAKKQVVLVGSFYTVEYMVRNEGRRRKATSLSRELRYLSGVCHTVIR